MPAVCAWGFQARSEAVCGNRLALNPNVILNKVRFAFLTESSVFYPPEYHQIQAVWPHVNRDVDDVVGVRPVNPILKIPVKLVRFVGSENSPVQLNFSGVIEFWSLWKGIASTPDQAARIGRNQNSDTLPSVLDLPVKPMSVKNRIVVFHVRFDGYPSPLTGNEDIGISLGSFDAFLAGLSRLSRFPRLPTDESGCDDSDEWERPFGGFIPNLASDSVSHHCWKRGPADLHLWRAQGRQ
jgi:hypothetical protein